MLAIANDSSKTLTLMEYNKETTSQNLLDTQGLTLENPQLYKLKRSCKTVSNYQPIPIEMINQMNPERWPTRLALEQPEEIEEEDNACTSDVNINID